MKSEPERNAQTVTIASTLALFVAVMLVGAAALWFLERMTDPSDQAQQTILTATFVAAVITSGHYLLRRRRPAGQPSDASNRS